MPNFLHQEIWKQMLDAARSSQSSSKIASAYISLAGIKYLPLKSGSKIVVDASEHSIISGSTDVKALDYLIKNKMEVYSLKNLHAKVFLFSGVAFVGSTNISASSRSLLIESSYMTRDKKDLRDIEKFIDANCQERIDVNAIEKLRKLPVVKKQMHDIALEYTPGRLIMELTGESRGTQVQPPVPIWLHFFKIGLDQERYPILHMMNLDEDTEFHPKNVVRHDHTLTVEIPGSDVERPAIIVITRDKDHYYTYKILSKRDANFEKFRTTLQTMHNPLRTHGRHWLIF